MPTVFPAASIRPAFRWKPSCLALALIAPLAGCGTTDAGPKFPPACPRALILGPAADLTRFSGRGGQDITDMVIDGRVTGVAGQCSLDDDGRLVTTVRVAIELTRGPAAKSRQEQVPLFVAMTKGDAVLDKQVFASRATFPTNIDRLRLASDDFKLTLPASAAKEGPSYTVYVGFQLSQDELALNRRRGVR